MMSDPSEKELQRRQQFIGGTKEVVKFLVKVAICGAVCFGIATSTNGDENLKSEDIETDIVVDLDAGGKVVVRVSGHPYSFEEADGRLKIFNEDGAEIGYINEDFLDVIAGNSFHIVQTENDIVMDENGTPVATIKRNDDGFRILDMDGNEQGEIEGCSLPELVAIFCSYCATSSSHM